MYVFVECVRKKIKEDGEFLAIAKAALLIDIGKVSMPNFTHKVVLVTCSKENYVFVLAACT